MSLEQKLINKVTRRTKQVRKSARGFRTYDKAFKQPTILAESPRAEELMRKAERRMDRNFGVDALQTRQLLAQEYVATSLTRHDYGVSDFGLQLTLPSNLEGYSASGIQAGDLVEVLQAGSQVRGQYLTVVAVTDSTHLRLTDVPSFSGTETSVAVRLEESQVKKSYF